MGELGKLEQSSVRRSVQRALCMPRKKGGIPEGAGLHRGAGATRRLDNRAPGVCSAPIRRAGVVLGAVDAVDSPSEIPGIARACTGAQL